MIPAILWTLLVLNFLRRFGSYRSLRPEAGPLPLDLPAVDVVVPARNEEAGFEASLATILGQEYPALRAIVVDDQSTDATLAIMRRMASADPRIVVVAGEPRPPGWVGKTWAVHQGYLQTRSDWICFVDADMGLHPRAIATAVESALRESADFVSIMPRVECRTFWQSTIAVSLLQFLLHLYPIDRTNDPRSSTAIAAGGFILVRRSAYDRAGGHEAGRHDIVDDILLARRVKAEGGRIYVRMAPDLARTHMYGSFGAIWRGLRKNAYAGMDYLFYKYAFGMTGAVFLAWAPLVALARGIATGSRWHLVVGLWGCLAEAAAALPVVAFLRISPWYALTVPAGMTAYAAIATSSVWHHHRGRILWKDRTLSSAEVRAGIAAGRTSPTGSGGSRPDGSTRETGPSGIAKKVAGEKTDE